MSLSKILVIIALICFFPVLVTTVDGLGAVDPEQLKLMRTLDASRWQAFRFAELPAALPAALSGARIALAVGVIGAFIGSFLGAAVFEYSYSRHTGVATRAAWGAVVGRAAGAAIKIALGLIIAIVGLFAALS